VQVSKCPILKEMST